MAAGGRHGKDQARAVWPPEPGFFSLRLARGAWAVPCRIVCDADGWRAVIDGCEHDPHADPALAEGIPDVWAYGRRISQEDYDWLLAVKRSAAANDPSHPSVNPHQAMDHRRLRPILPRGG